MTQENDLSNSEIQQEEEQIEPTSTRVIKRTIVVTNQGHRGRLKERFDRAPIRTMPDYEILEMLLFAILARRDTKGISKQLLTRFGCLPAVIFADPGDIKSTPGVGESVVSYIRLLADLFSRLCIPIKSGHTHILNNWVSVLNYCQLTMGFKKKEYFRVLFLNKKNILVADEFIDSGTVDRIAIYPREVAKQSLLHSASAVILIHNHPSGDANPSKEDIEVTKKIHSALAAINVNMHDHIIVAQHEHFSFRTHNLI